MTTSISRKFSLSGARVCISALLGFMLLICCAVYIGNRGVRMRVRQFISPRPEDVFSEQLLYDSSAERRLGAQFIGGKYPPQMCFRKTWYDNNHVRTTLYWDDNPSSGGTYVTSGEMHSDNVAEAILRAEGNTWVVEKSYLTHRHGKDVPH